MSKIATQKRGESIPFLLAMTVAGRWFSRSESKQSLSMDDNEQDCHSKIYVQTQNSASPTIINFMPIISGEILEVRLESDGSQSGRILLSQALRIEPGQYLLVDAFRTGNAPPQAVFVLGGADRELELAAPMPSDWVVGTQLSIRGPLGTGFHLPAGARKVALAALDGGPHRLLPLIERTLAQGGDVALYGSGDLPDHLPLAVEVLPLNQLSQAPNWADYIALDVPLEMVADLAARLELSEGRRCPCQAEVLISTPMPCGGIAECGVCAVHTNQGWRLACKDGPVFNLDILLER
jgi:NAD(P)H-flavin reductase